jgi:hypothetical protein
MGADRNTLPQLGYPMLPLCPICHGAWHADEKGFNERYHLIPVPITKELGKIYNLPKETMKPSRFMTEG